MRRSATCVGPSADRAPWLSVIVAVGGAIDALAPLAAQARDGRVEVIVVTDDAGAHLRPDPPLKILRLPGRATLPRLLGAGLAEAQGEIIGVLDAGCPPDPSWVTVAIEAHIGSHPVVGGAVEPEGLRTCADWAGYFLDYGRFMLPLAPGAAPLVPGINITMKRWALDRDRRYVAPEFWKAYWCRALQAGGHTLHLAPSLLVRYRRRLPLGALLAQRFHHGRCFAGMRLEQISLGRRLVYLAGSPALPLLLLARLLRALLPKRRRFGALARALPVIVLGTVGWALGELFGYLAGPGGSCRHVR